MNHFAKRWTSFCVGAACACTLLLTPVGAANQYEAYGQVLKTMGVMTGDEHGDLTLDSGATRVQGLIMLLRLTGQIDAASKYTGSMPFKDVSEHYKPYVAYAYANQITAGMSDTEFGTDLPMNYKMYLSFLMRSLGYTDSGNNKDFTYDGAMDKAVSIGLVKEEERAAVEQADVFDRGTLAYYSFQALFLPMKGQSTTSLIESLTAQGKFSVQSVIQNDLFAAYYNKVLSD